MTHFAALVVGDDVEGQLQPYHEFECTGTNDRYVIDVDKTAEALAEYAEQPGDYPTFLAFLSGWYGADSIVKPGQEPDRDGDHKYGYVRVNEAGEAIQYIDRTNPNKKWDWWLVGGRWSGFFLLRQEANAVPALGSPGIFGRGHPIDARTTDSAPAGEIDWEMMAARAKQEAEANYDEWIAKGRRLREADWEYGIRWLPEVQAIWDGICKARVPTDEDRTRWWAERRVEDLESKEAYAHRRANRAGVTRAVVRDGQWFERGRAGWFGMFDEKISEEDWDRLYWEMIGELPPDMLLTVVDCHI